ncbi:MAG: hypothetical protein A3C47_01095 [Omnitrophica bacterium RIFCSPHIGHO2_02_FULL_51_18]|nr:MAG: hypothetical protein A3C47_01095 [Omnitrophica bacterium RIFCSPHIGHO2_02_FULL_51_18]
MRKRIKRKHKKAEKPRKLSFRRVKKTLRKIRSKVSRKSFKKHKIKDFISSFTAFPKQNGEFQGSRSAGFEFPSSYHENKLVLLVRDPWWVFAYWEVTPEREKEVLREILQKSLQKDKTVLRVYEITGTSPSHPNSSFDIELNFFTNNWYIDVGRPDTDWIAEIGIRTTHGHFFALVRSNAVKTPRFGLSDVLDEEWMMPDDLYWKLFGRMAGLSDRKSSLDVREVLERYLKGMVSSQSFPAPRKKS